MRDVSRSGHAPEPAARGSLGLLVDPTFGPYFAAKVAASVGIWIYNIVAAVAVFQMTGSVLLVGAVSVAQFLPQVLLAPLAGARADRHDRQRQVAAGRLMVVGGSGALAAWVGIASVEGLPGAAPVIVASFVVGVGFAVGAPAMHAILPAMVRAEELSSAVALSQVPFTLARAAGPALGVLILTTAGPAPAFAVTAAANAIYVVVLLRLRLRPTERGGGGDGSVRGGLRHLRGDPVCAILLGAVFTVGLGVDPVITLTPPLAESLGGGEQLVGLLASAFGAGAAVTVIILGRIRRRVGLQRLAPGGLGLFAGSLGALALAPSAPWAVTALAVGGLGMMIAISSLTTLLQQRLPEGLRGRVMALWSVAFVGSRPLAATINGAIADYATVELALLLSAAVVAVGAVLARPRRTAPSVEA